MSNCNNPTCARNLGDVQMDLDHWRDRAKELEEEIVELRNVLVGGAERGGLFWREDAVEETKRIVPIRKTP